MARLECRCNEVVRSGSKLAAALATASSLALSACGTLPGAVPGSVSSPGSPGAGGPISATTNTAPNPQDGKSAAVAATGKSARSVVTPGADGKPAEGKPAESRSAESKSADGKAGETKPADGKLGDASGNDGRLTEPRSMPADNANSPNNAGLGTRELDPATDDGQAAIIVSPQKPQTERDLWERIRKGFALAPLNSPLVAEKEKFYLQQPEYLDRMMTRGGRYLFHIVEEVEKRGLPTELALLPFVESAMNPVAMSSARASGLWQFMPATGKFFNLSQNWWVDDRRDVVHSTRAALDYLQKLHAMHGKDWNLALASYNWGEGAVGRAVRKNRERGRPADYLSLDMPNETRHYVPKLMAIRNLIANASQRGLALPNLPNKPYFVTIEKTRPIDLKLAAQFAGMSTEEFVALNPAHNRPVIAATKNNEIKLPADRLDAFVAAVTKHDQLKKTFASWQPYTLKEGETLDSVAQRGGVSVAELQKANSLKQNTKILPGTHLLAPNSKPIADERKVESFVAPRVYEQVNNPAIHHVVGKRETLYGIARRYGVNAQKLLAMNGHKKINSGTTLLVRPASSHTLLTTEHGEQQVIATKASLARPAAETGDADKGATTPKKAVGKSEPVGTEKSRSRAEKQSRSSADSKVAGKAVQSVRTKQHAKKSASTNARASVGKSTTRTLAKDTQARKPARG